MVVAARLLCAVAAVVFGYLTLAWCIFSGWGMADESWQQVSEAGGELALAGFFGVLTATCALYALRGNLRLLWLAVLAGLVPVAITIWSRFTDVV